MSRRDENELDDPALKAALRRSCGDSAPRELRRKVTELFTASAEPAARPRSFYWKTSPLVALAAAAVIVLAIGSLFWQYRSMYLPRQHVAAGPLIPPTLLSDIV